MRHPPPLESKRRMACSQEGKRDHFQVDVSLSSLGRSFTQHLSHAHINFLTSFPERRKDCLRESYTLVI